MPLLCQRWRRQSAACNSRQRPCREGKNQVLARLVQQAMQRHALTISNLGPRAMQPQQQSFRVASNAQHSLPMQATIKPLASPRCEAHNPCSAAANYQQLERAPSLTNMPPSTHMPLLCQRWRLRPCACVPATLQGGGAAHAHLAHEGSSASGRSTRPEQQKFLTVEAELERTSSEQLPRTVHGGG